jgi:hypothetical protein
MAVVKAQLAELSAKADVLLDKHQHVLSELGLTITFNRSTLATKYWLPLPDVSDFASGPDASKIGSRHGSVGQPLTRALENGIRCLDKFDELAAAVADIEKLDDHEKSPLSLKFRE